MRKFGIFRNYFGVLAAALVILLIGFHAVRTRAQSSSITVTITPTSATTLTIGAAFTATVTMKNTTAGSLSPAENFYLIYPDGTRLAVPPNSPGANIAAGRTTSVTKAATSSAYTNQTGTFKYEADAVNSGGTVLGSATVSFTILPLPSGIIPPQFSDLSAYAGIAAVHHDDTTDCMNAMGTGAGWADYDGDGFLDLFISDFNGASHLYHNNQNLTFTDVTATAFPNSLTGGSLNLPHATGVTWADYDNDGHPDLLVVATGHPYLFHNNGNGTFTDVTTTAGLSTLTYRGESAAWGDFDGDGYLDLFVVYYNQNCIAIPVANTPRAPSHLFHNNANGTFTEVTNYLGGTSNPAVTGFGFQASWFDYNNDGRPGLLVVNDFGNSIHSNVLWRNDGSDGKGGWIFTDVSVASGANSKMESMGIALGDYNRDGFLDFQVSNLGPNVFLANNGNGTFSNKGQILGAERTALLNSSRKPIPSFTWGLGMFDFNNDGYEDLFIAAGETGARIDVTNALLVNNYNAHLTQLSNDGVFMDWSYLSGAQGPTNAHTVAFADFDADGWMDMLVENFHNQGPQLFRNEGPAVGNTNNWLQVRLIGACQQCAPNTPGMSNRDGVGAKLTLTAGSDVQYRQIIDGDSLGAGNQLAAHFGLGTHTSVDSLKVVWPSGVSQTFTALPANQRLVITEGSGVLGNDPVPPRIPK